MKPALSHRRISLNGFGTHSANFEKAVSKSEAADVLNTPPQGEKKQKPWQADALAASSPVKNKKYEQNHAAAVFSCL